MNPLIAAVFAILVVSASAVPSGLILGAVSTHSQWGDVGPSGVVTGLGASGPSGTVTGAGAAGPTGIVTGKGAIGPNGPNGLGVIAAAPLVAAAPAAWAAPAIAAAPWGASAWAGAPVAGAWGLGGKGLAWGGW